MDVNECKIVKRNGSQVDYDRDKIERAIGLAMGETDESLEWGKYEEMIAYIEGKIVDGMTVEGVSDVVQRAMMKFDLCESAERYISHRIERNTSRSLGDKDLNSRYFSKDFLKKYMYTKEPFDPLGGFVKARTYARWNEKKGRRETWFETVKRAVEFNLSLAKHTKEEAELLFHNVFYLKQNLSGRMTWLGGTPTSHSNALGLFNCAFDIVDSFDTFVEGFTVLMLGAGLGVRITKEDVSKIPKVRAKTEMINKVFEPVNKRDRKEYTSLVEHSKNLVEIVIADSRGGWTTALGMYFDLMYSTKYKEVDTILINYDNIRLKDERIKGFGGKSSGHESVMTMFTSIHDILSKSNEDLYALTTLDALDIICHIALNVVSGNVRRSSLMVLCDEDDHDIINAKANMYTKVNGEWVINKKLIQRQMSNNTIIYKKKPSREVFSNNFKKLRTTGEPATLNLEQALKRNPNAKGLNPLTL